MIGDTGSWKWYGTSTRTGRVVLCCVVDFGCDDTALCACDDGMDRRLAPPPATDAELSTTMTMMTQGDDVSFMT